MVDGTFLQDHLAYFTAFGVITAFILAAYTTLRNERTRRVTNYLALVTNHRAIWTMLFQYEELNQVLGRGDEMHTRPISEREEMFITFVILNLRANYEMMLTNSVVAQSALEADAKAFFSLPLPRRVWEETKRFQDDRFVAFVDRALTGR